MHVIDVPLSRRGCPTLDPRRCDRGEVSGQSSELEDWAVDISCTRALGEESKAVNDLTECLESF